MTKAEKIAELEELRALAVAALKKAYKAKSYAVGDRSKQMPDVKALREEIRYYDRQLKALRAGKLDVSYGVWTGA